jgi:hypothetical protein
MTLRKHTKTSNWMRLWKVIVTEPKAFRAHLVWRIELIVQSTTKGGAERAAKKEFPDIFPEGANVSIDPINSYAVKHLEYRVKPRDTR